MLSESERLNYLIKMLEGGNAKAFADKTGIIPSTVSRIRAGKLRLNSKVDTILKAYPTVSRTWLETGEGAPGDISIQFVTEKYDALLQQKEQQIQLLLKELELQQKIIEKLTNDQ